MYKIDPLQDWPMNVAGTVIEATFTLRPQDLIPAFIDALRIIEHANPVLLSGLDELEAGTKIEGYFDTESAQFDLDYLFDLLDACAGDNHYFGAHPGDGADFGFWEVEQ